MAYFNELPNIQYLSRFADQSSNEDYTLAKNIFRRARLREDVANAATAFQYYQIKDDERPDQIAERIYGDPELDWVVLITNNITNYPSQWTLSNDSFYEYLIDKYGSEEELDIYHAVKIENKGTKEEVKLADPNKFSPYARFFDEGSTEWTKDPEMNRLFVTCQQNYLNHILQVRGHVFLNEAYDALGLERSSAGAVVGWVISQDSDNYIDFGIFEAQNARFINGIERSILLDFNVDGVIYDKIGRKK